jgi:riboflavin kinase/FMN adenylyltransferase
VIGSAVERARDLRTSAVVYTFDPHPRRVLNPSRPELLLMTPEQLELALEELGVNVLVREGFTLEFAALTPEAFLRDVLCERMEPQELVVGRDFHFGKGRGGSGETLATIAPTLGLRVVIVPEVQAEGRDVSSSRIRMALTQGDVEDARRCLGRPYVVWGKVVGGDGRGRSLGFPTANLDPENEILPTRGVYATRARLIEGGGRTAGPSLPSVTNVGTRPTFEGEQLVCETHLIDFEADLYGKRLEVGFLGRLRSEQKFADADALHRQIREDIERARSFQGAGPE